MRHGIRTSVCARKSGAERTVVRVSNMMQFMNCVVFYWFQGETL